MAKANKDTEAGVMPTAQAWEDMDQFNEELVKAGIVLVGEGLKPVQQAFAFASPERTVSLRKARLLKPRS